MNDWKKLGMMSVASIAVFALAGCGQANARVQASNARPANAVVAVVDTAHATADADADNGPGCAESALNGGARTAK